MELIQRSSLSGAEDARYLLACSSTPPHLRTFLHAYLLRQHPEFNIEVDITVYGDLLGSLESFEPGGYMGAVAVCEWYDLDPRLGFRRLGGWAPSLFEDIVSNARKNLARLRLALERVKLTIPVVVVLPTLPLAPLEISVPGQAAAFEVQLWSLVWEFASWCTSCEGIRLLSPAELDRNSPPSQRFDLRTELAHGFPYRLAHASALAELATRLLAPPAPLKGLITDLDDTLWDGILGEVGVSGIRFTLDTGAQIHGLYQQFLESLAERGVLLAVASKNDAALAEEAFCRPDLLVRRASFFPAEVHWRPKSESVANILRVWNIGADTVAFVDDSPLETAEVQAHFPEIRTLLFSKNDPDRLLEFFATLRNWFGKPTIRGEDHIRSQSLQSNASFRQGSIEAASQQTFLDGIDAHLSFQVSRDAADARALELINKTNQFNLNGHRIPEARWREFFNNHEAFLLTVIYSDKFGPLGKIAAVLGRVSGSDAEISTWVMSCRAFSRRIEYATLRYLFERLNLERVTFQFEATPRNNPFRHFLAEMQISESCASLSRADIDARCPQFPYALEEFTAHV